MTGPVVIATGGTGGHLHPALAVAEELLGRGREVVAVTDPRGATLAGLPERVRLHVLRASAISGRNLAGRITGVVDLLRGVFEARRLLRSLGPAVVAGFGGYPSVAPLLAARRLGMRTMIHEQNAVLGRANRLLAPRVDLVATSFDETDGAEGRRPVVCGNPVRSAIAALHDRPYRAPGTAAETNLLAFGGSQGARVLGEVLPAALGMLPDPVRGNLAVVQQCRSGHAAEVRAAYEASGIAASVAEFFDDMAERLAAAHLVIARAGASTVAELQVAGRPAILVPYPHATDDHQAANARRVEAAGAGWLIPEESLDPADLAARLETLLASPGTLERAAAAARRSARRDAARSLADAIEHLAGSNGDHGGVRSAITGRAA